MSTTDEFFSAVQDSVDQGMRAYADARGLPPIMWSVFLGSSGGLEIHGVTAQDEYDATGRVAVEAWLEHLGITDDDRVLGESAVHTEWSGVFDGISLRLSLLNDDVHKLGGDRRG